MTDERLEAEVLLKKLKSDPIHLVWVIAQNNPTEVGAGLKDLGHTAITPEEVMAAVSDAVYDVDAEVISKVLSVNFNELAENATAEYMPLIEMRIKELDKKGIAAGNNWGDLFGDTIAAFPAAIADFDGKTLDGEPAKPKKKCTTCGPAAVDYQDSDMWLKLAAVIGVIVAVYFIIKHWK